MTWVTWRQSRTELLIFVIALAATATFLIWTSLDIRSRYDGLSNAGCLITGEESAGCEQQIFDFVEHFESIRNLTFWFNFVPMLLGILLAAPLVLDLEHGTYRLAWTQGVSRTRWLALKIALGLGALTAVTLALFALWFWWGRPLITTERLDMFERFDSAFFNNGGPVLVTFAIFAFALCLAAGAVTRRSIAAFGVALVAFTGIRILIETKIRMQYLSPVKEISDALPERGSVRQGAFVISSGPSDKFGNILPWNNPAVQECFGPRREFGPKPAPEQVNDAIEATTRCLRDHDLYYTTIYQPAGRFWTFQGIESAIFLVMSVILLGISFYWVTRRIAR